MILVSRYVIHWQCWW